MRFLVKANSISHMNRVRIAWLVLTIVLLSLAVAAGIAYGRTEVILLLVVLLLPDVALIGAFAGHGRLKPHRVAWYNAMHAPVVPVVVLAAAGIAALSGAWGLLGARGLLLAALAWAAHIALDRALGYGLREPDGTIRPVGSADALTPTWCTSS